jgi:hypothetical protein
MRLEPGMMIRFTYKHYSVDDQTGDKFKEVLVLNPKFNNKVHAIDLKRVSPAERWVLEQLIDPKQKNIPSRHPFVNSIKRRIGDFHQSVKNPTTFYSLFVKPFLKDKDAYRTYFPERMINPSEIKGETIGGKKINKNPMGGGPKPPPAPMTPRVAAMGKPLSPIDVMAQNARNRGLK